MTKTGDPYILGLFIHNQSGQAYKDVVNAIIEKILDDQTLNIKFSNFDSIAFDNEYKYSHQGEMKILSKYLELSGFMVDFMPPSVIYKITQKVLIHYIAIKIKDAEWYFENYSKFIREWEEERLLNVQDSREKKIIRMVII